MDSIASMRARIVSVLFLLVGTFGARPQLIMRHAITQTEVEANEQSGWTKSAMNKACRDPETCGVGANERCRDVFCADCRLGSCSTLQEAQTCCVESASCTAVYGGGAHWWTFSGQCDEENHSNHYNVWHRDVPQVDVELIEGPNAVACAQSNILSDVQCQNFAESQDKRYVSGLSDVYKNLRPAGCFYSPGFDPPTFFYNDNLHSSYDFQNGKYHQACIKQAFSVLLGDFHFDDASSNKHGSVGTVTPVDIDVSRVAPIDQGSNRLPPAKFTFGMWCQNEQSCLRMIEYTQVNNDVGIMSRVPAPVGGWSLQKWHYIETPVADSDYRNASHIDWTTMGRIELYIAGKSAQPVGLKISDLRLVPKDAEVTTTTTTTTAIPALYFTGDPGTNVCPIGSSKLMTQAECEVALNALGLTFLGPTSWSGGPSGCIVKSGQTSVYFNTHGANTEQSGYGPMCLGSQACVDVLPPSSWANPTCESQRDDTNNCAARRAGTNTDGYCAKTCGVCQAAQ